MARSDFARVLVAALPAGATDVPPGPPVAEPTPEPEQLVVTIDVPIEGATLTTGEAVTLSGTVTAGAAVAIALGVTSLGSAVVVGTAWSLAVTPDSGWLGAHTITATATKVSALDGTDTAGIVGAAPAAPTVSLVAPVASGVLYPDVPCTLVAACANATSVEFFSGATSLGAATPSGGLAFLGRTPAYSEWGARSLTAVATGPGGQTTSAAVSIRVGPSNVLGAYVADVGYLAESDTSTPENGDAVTAWVSGTGSSSGTAAANSPTFTASDAVLNSKGAVAFASASSQRMAVDGLATSFQGVMGASHTIVASMKPVTLASNATLFSTATNSSASGFMWWFILTTGFLRLNVTGDNGLSSVSSSTALVTGLTANTKQVLSVQYSATTRIASLWVRGTRMNAGALGTTPAQVTPNNATIGGHRPLTPTGFDDGSKRMLFVLSGVDDTTVRETLESVCWADQGSPAPGVGEYDTSAYALHNFSTSGFYRAPPIALPRTIGVVFRYTDVSAVARDLVSAFQGTGWAVTLLASGAIQVVGASASVVTTALAVQGQITGVLVSDDGAGNIRVWVNRGLAQTVAATISVASHELVIGARSESHDTPAKDARVSGVVVSTTTPVATQDDADAWFDACKAEQDCAALIAGTTHRWSAKGKMSNLVPDTTWAAETGSVDMVLYGTVSVGENPASVQSWGWT